MSSRFRVKRLKFDQSLAIHRQSDLPDLDDQLNGQRSAPQVETGVDKEEEEEVSFALFRFIYHTNYRFVYSSLKRGVFFFFGIIFNTWFPYSITCKLLYLHLMPLTRQGDKILVCIFLRPMHHKPLILKNFTDCTKLLSITLRRSFDSLPPLKIR